VFCSTAHKVARGPHGARVWVGDSFAGCGISNVPIRVAGTDQLLNDFPIGSGGSRRSLEIARQTDHRAAAVGASLVWLPLHIGTLETLSATEANMRMEVAPRHIGSSRWLWIDARPHREPKSHTPMLLSAGSHVTPNVFAERRGYSRLYLALYSSRVRSSELLEPGNRGASLE
jgi:hypothetical protein